MSTKDVKKQYSIIFTIFFFTILVSSITPVGAISGTPAPESDVIAQTAVTPKATVKSVSTTKPSPISSDSPKKTASPSGSVKGVETANNKMTVYKGEVSATPSAVGKFLVKTDSGDKNIDTDKKTKVFIYDNDKKTLSTVTKLKVGEKVSVLGTMTEGGNSLLAQYVLVYVTQTAQTDRGAMYGTVSSREASGSAFLLKIKSPGKGDEKSFILNASSQIKVKEVDAPKLSDIKIGDRVTFTYYIEDENAYITHIFSIPGRAAGLLRDIREASGSPTASPKTSPASASGSPKASVKPTGSPVSSAKASVKPTSTPKGE